MKESAIQSKILKALNALPQTKAMKIHVGQYMPAGTPDVLCISKGVPFWFEVKRPGEEPTKLQVLTHKQWRESGANVFVVHSVEETLNALEQTMTKGDDAR